MSPTIPALVCLPFGGSGASFYRAWAGENHFGVELLPLQLPGREELFTEEPFTDALTAARWLTGTLLDQVADVAHFALFGHSLGAVLAFEVARECERRGVPGLTRLHVSGSPAPWNGRQRRASDVEDDDEFLLRVNEFAGYRHQALDHPELRELLLPSLRADVVMHENYRPDSTKPVVTPITAMRGAGDALVSEQDAREWSGATRGDFTYVELPGGHMYLAESPDLVLRTVAVG